MKYPKSLVFSFLGFEFDIIIDQTKAREKRWDMFEKQYEEVLDKGFEELEELPMKKKSPKKGKKSSKKK